MGRTVTPSDTNSFTPHPEGVFAAVVADWRDDGLQASTFNGTTKFQEYGRLYFVTTEHLDDGRAFGVWGRRFTYSLHKKANLAALVKTLLGRALEDGEALDIEDLIGRTCLVQVEHSEGSDGTIYANVVGVMPLPKGMPASDLSEYKRRFDDEGHPLDSDRMAEWMTKQRAVEALQKASVAAKKIGATGVEVEDDEKPEKVAQALVVQAPVDTDDLPF